MNSLLYYRKSRKLFRSYLTLPLLSPVRIYFAFDRSTHVYENLRRKQCDQRNAMWTAVEGRRRFILCKHHYKNWKRDFVHSREQQKVWHHIWLERIAHNMNQGLFKNTWGERWGKTAEALTYYRLLRRVKHLKSNGAHINQSLNLITKVERELI